MSRVGSANFGDFLSLYFYPLRPSTAAKSLLHALRDPPERSTLLLVLYHSYFLVTKRLPCRSASTPVNNATHAPVVSRGLDGNYNNRWSAIFGYSFPSLKSDTRESANQMVKRFI